MMTHDSFNFNLPGYRAIAEIYRAAKTVVYRAETIEIAIQLADILETS